MLSKDAFWNSNHVTVYDSFISGEYLGWNARNLTLVNCTIESLQGMCYIENLKMMNCKLINTTLAFEYSTVDAQIVNTVDSVLNPSGGIIRADKIGAQHCSQELYHLSYGFMGGMQGKTRHRKRKSQIMHRRQTTAICHR